MNGNEHRDIRNTAYGGALVNVGGDSPAERFWLSFGDVMGLSGDYFSPTSAEGSRDGIDADDGDLGAGGCSTWRGSPASTARDSAAVTRSSARCM